MPIFADWMSRSLRFRAPSGRSHRRPVWTVQHATRSQSDMSVRRRVPLQVALAEGVAEKNAPNRHLVPRKPGLSQFLHSINNAGAEPAPIAMRWARVAACDGTWHVDSSYDLFGERQSMFYRTLENVSMRSSSLRDFGM